MSNVAYRSPVIDSGYIDFVRRVQNLTSDGFRNEADKFEYLRFRLFWQKKLT